MKYLFTVYVISIIFSCTKLDVRDELIGKEDFRDELIGKYQIKKEIQENTNGPKHSYYSDSIISVKKGNSESTLFVMGNNLVRGENNGNHFITLFLENDSIIL